ncbi:hypothetical protein, partial [Asanoa sp. NPDC050611]|uniref:hypothetical protein n=1 Tax=Asanoa sp. NPDC050611 TaxID=3157098 RepID=UPI0033D30FC1
MDDSGQPGDAPGGGGNPPASRDGDAWADRDRDPGSRSAWHRTRYANLLTPIVPASRQPRQHVNGSGEVHSASAPPYPYEGDLEDEAHSPIPTQPGGDEPPPAPPWPDPHPPQSDWRGWAPAAGNEALPEPPSPWAPGWAPAQPDAASPDTAPPAPPAPAAPDAGGTALPGPFAAAFPPAPPRFEEPAPPPPVRFRPRQEEPPARPPMTAPEPDTAGGFPPIGAVAAGAPTDSVAPGTPTEADPYPAAGQPRRQADWAPEWPWSPAPPSTAGGRLSVPASRPQPEQPAEPPPAPPDEGALPSRRDYPTAGHPTVRNTLPGYIRGGAGPSGDEARFITGSHPVVPANRDGGTPSGGFPVVEPGGATLTPSGNFPVVDRRSAGLTRSFPSSQPADPPGSPSRLTRAFPGGDDPTPGERPPLSGAFPGGAERRPDDSDRPTDLAGRRAAPPDAPVERTPADVPPPRPPLRLASRNGDQIGEASAPREPGPTSGAPVGAAAEPPPPIPLGRRPVDPAAEQRSVVDDMLDELASLPQRVPAEPDVPTAPEPPSDTPADPPQLARIATHLRRADLPTVERERPDGFDVKAIIAAVRGVSGVQDATLRTTESGAHSLRLDLSDGADPAEVSRHVARLLQERMGLAAAPPSPLGSVPPADPPSAPFGGDTPPTGFSRSGGYVPPAPAAPTSRPTSAAPTSRPTSAAPASRPTSAQPASRPTSGPPASRPTSGPPAPRPTSG